MFKKYLKILIFLIFLFIGAFYMKKFFNKKEKEIEKKAYLINVLDKEEFNDANIKGSINIPFEDIKEINKFDKNSKLIFYCANFLCTSSDEAAIYASKKGFKDVYVYKGGTAEWYQFGKEEEGYDLVGPAKEDYLEMIVPFKEEYLNEGDNKKYFKIISKKELQELIKSNIL